MFLFAPFFPRIYNTTEAVRKAAMGLVLAQAVFIPQNAFLNAAYFTLRAGGKTGVTFSLTVYSYGASTFRSFCFMPIYRTCPVGGLQCDADRGMAEVYCGRAVMVKKGVWRENLTGKGEDGKNIFCGKNEEKH